MFAELVSGGKNECVSMCRGFLDLGSINLLKIMYEWSPKCAWLGMGPNCSPRGHDPPKTRGKTPPPLPAVATEGCQGRAGNELPGDASELATEPG